MTAEPARQFKDAIHSHVPDITQFNQIKELTKPSDKFHTFRSRSKANIRERINVDSREVDESFRIASDIDGNYVKEMFNERTREFYRFLPRTSAARTREILRRKLEICWMREKIIRTEIELKTESGEVADFEAQEKSYDDFLNDLKEQEFKKTMRMMQESKEPFKVLESLRNQHDELETRIEPLKMRIFVLANDFMRLLIYQNFQFLIKPLEWREEHDWIHKQADGSLEDVRESLESRMTKNLWSRDSMTVYSIKSFIEGEFATKPKPLRAFHSSEAMQLALDENRMRSKQSLMKFHVVACSFDEARETFSELEITNQNCIVKMESNMRLLQQRRVFFEDRAVTLQLSVKELLKRPLRESISSTATRESATLVNFLFEKAILKNQDSSSSKNYSLREKMMALERKVLDLLIEIDQMPPVTFKECEVETRNERRKKWKVAKRAFRIECELKEQILQFQRCIAKPPPKKIHKGKLPRSELPKKTPKPKPPTPPLTGLEQDFLRAFTNVDPRRRKVRFSENAKQTLGEIRNRKSQKCCESVEYLIAMLGLSDDVAESKNI